MKKFTLLIFLFHLCFAYSQNDSIFERLQAVKVIDITFYNVDGFEIVSKHINKPFNEKGLKKVYRKFAIKKNKEKKIDTSLSYKNYYVEDREEISDILERYNIIYFVENHGLVTAIQISSLNKRNKEFERTIIKHIIEQTIPKKNFNSRIIDTINFVGRKIKLGSNCEWMGANNVQCPYFGQMNWSVHKDFDSAKNSLDNQLNYTKSNKKGKVISEEVVDIQFEDIETQAKIIIYDIKGINSILVGLEGAETLTVYYVATEVRGNFVSCVLSFWNNDAITDTGLPPLLNEVMKIK